jgi:squalene synthase HpnC
VGVDHYENFPVASVLSPPHLRPAIVAIYHFARTADDLADEGSVPAAERLALLERYRRDLHATYRGDARSGLWEAVFVPLARARDRYALPLAPLDDLLSAFIQDTGNPRYPDRALLLDYCRRSANPVGRLLLHLYGVEDARALQWADDICTALQLINFWQDLSVDVPRGRCYVPESDAREHGLDPAGLTAANDSPAARALVRDLCDWAEGLMLRGAPLARQLPGRGGWELRFVVAGGLRVIDKIRRLGYATALTRPTLGLSDAPALLLHALRLPRVPLTEATA